MHGDNAIHVILEVDFNNKRGAVVTINSGNSEISEIYVNNPLCRAKFLPEAK